MKKKLALILAGVMMLASLAACGTTGTASGSGEAPAGEAKITLATGGTSGTYYAVGGAMQTVLNDKLALSDLNVTSTGASKVNVNMITDGEAEMAILQSDVISYAHTGTNTFEATGVEDNALWVAGLYNETVQIVATPDITSIDQLRGKTVCVGDVGSGTEVNTKQVLAAHGITFDDITVVHGSFQVGVDGIKDGKIDATFTVAGAPTTAITELATANTFSLISLSDEALAKIAADYPFLVQDNLPAGTYNGIDQETKCVAVQAALVASEDVSEDVVYEMLKAMFDNADALKAAHAKFEYLDPAYAAKGTVPLHPGAEKYYKEIGIIE